MLTCGTALQILQSEPKYSGIGRRLLDSSFRLLKVQMNMRIIVNWPGNRNKVKGNGAGLAWESQSHCFADKFGITHAHSFGTDTQHDYSKVNFFTVLISK